MAGRLLGSFPPDDAPGAFGGVWPSMHDMSVPFVKDARNVVFTASGIRKMDGWIAPISMTQTSAAIRGMTQIYANGKNTIIYGTPSALNKYEDGSSEATVVATGFNGITDQTSATEATVWSMVNFGNWVLATNGVDVPQVYKGTAFAALALSSQFSTAKLLAKNGPYVLAFSLGTAGGSMVDKFAWCHTDDVEQWSPTLSNAAGSLTMRDLGSEVIAVAPLADRIAAYGNDCMFLVSFIGSPFFFSAQRTLDGIGAVSKHCVVAVGRRNFGLSRQGFWVTDGTDFNWIDEPAIRNWFQKRINWNQRTKINAYHDKRNQQVVWYYPTGANLEPNEGVGYDYSKNVWTIYDHGRTVAHDATIFQYPSAGTDNGRLFFHGYGKNANGAPLGCWVESARLSLGTPENFKEVLELRTGVHDLTGNMSVAISGVRTLSQTASYGSGVSINESFSKVNVREMGRYISLLYRSTSTGADFIITNVRMHGEIKGVD